MNKLSLFGKDILCPHFALCSGCQIDTNVDEPPILNEARTYFNQAGIDQLPIKLANPIGWRYRAKLAIRGASSNPHIGLYKEGTHEVVDIPFCKVHHPKINDAVYRLRTFIINNDLTPYNETDGSGVIRYAQFVVERTTGKVQISLVLNSKSVNPEQFNDLWKNNKEQFWHSIWVNLNTRRDNVIFGEQWQHLFGEPLIWERLAGVDICFQPSSFAQANLDLYEEMLESIKQKVPKNSIVAEFYAGVGVIGLALIQQCAEVKCGEVNPFAEYCFQQSRTRLPKDMIEKVSWHQGKSSQLGGILSGADVIIVDPPRQGLEQELLKMIIKSQQAKQLIYISCGWKSFQRDANQLMENGWKLSDAEIFLLFPGSNHIETLATFRLRSQD